MVSNNAACQGKVRYQSNLNQMLSDVDKEIGDLMDYIELNNLNDCELLKVSRMLQNCRRKRRRIKDELEKTELMKNSFLNKTFTSKVQQTLSAMKKMDERKYTPRKLNELFAQQYLK